MNPKTWNSATQLDINVTTACNQDVTKKNWYCHVLLCTHIVSTIEPNPLFCRIWIQKLSSTIMNKTINVWKNHLIVLAYLDTKSRKLKGCILICSVCLITSCLFSTELWKNIQPFNWNQKAKKNICFKFPAWASTVANNSYHFWADLLIDGHV